MAAKRNPAHKGKKKSPAKRAVKKALRKPGNIAWLIILFGFMFAVPAWMTGEPLSFSILLFVASLFLLLKSADWLVDGSSEIARYFGIPQVIIGLTVVAFGTSLPELTVSIIANLSGSPGLSIGNIVGSNISNICLVLGIATILVPVTIRRETLRLDLPFLLGASLLLPLLSLRMFFDMSSSAYVIGMVDGLILLGVFAGFMYVQLRSAEEHRARHCRIGTRGSCGTIDRKRVARQATVTLAGILGVVVSADLLVRSGQDIAMLFGVPEMLIGLTMVAVGTSIPELGTNLVAAAKKRLDLAVGNVIGSNVFNIAMVLGVSSLMRPIEGIAEVAVSADMPIMVGITALFIGLILRGKNITRRDGIILLGIYALYVAYLATRI